MLAHGIRDSAHVAELLAPYEAVRPIGSRPNPLYVARSGDPGDARPQLFVAECLLGAAHPAASDAASGDFLTRARRVATLASANVPRVRELVVRGEDVIVFGNFIDGEKLIEVWNGMRLDVALRVVVDVLSGLGALHNARDLELRPMGLFHGEVAPATILFALDGTARLLYSIARLVPGAARETASAAYLAPEAHSGDACGASTDVFGAGVLLWEALSGARLFDDREPAAMVASVRAGVAPPPLRDSSPWAAALVDVATRALAAAPGDRWPTAAAMAAEIRRAAGPHIASAAEIGAFARDLMSARAKARREDLESSPSGMPSSAESRAKWHARVENDEPIPVLNHEPESVTTEVDDRSAFPDVVESKPPQTDAGASALVPSANSVDVSFSSLSTAGAVPQPARIAEPPGQESLVRTSSRRRSALWAGAGLVGVGALALAAWRLGHHDA
ncbi:MAG: hypothetical protein M3O50_21095, partial [Myxococcota bacterium]|nr:hypothetical protein [Myxococcota bacterium]